jgi:hypothetical protein
VLVSWKLLDEVVESWPPQVPTQLVFQFVELLVVLQLREREQARVQRLKLEDHLAQVFQRD